MTKNNMKFRQLLTRCTAVPVAFVGLALNAFADNKVTIEDFSIKLNEEKTVAIYLENTDAIAALQMDIVLPKELSYVSNSIVRNEERLDRDTHSLMMQYVDGDNDVNIYRLLIVPSSMDNIEGNSGAIAYFTVKADAFNEVDKIRFENIVGSRLPDGSADTKVEVTGDETTVSPYAGFVQMGAEALEIKTDGTSKKVDVQLTNHITVRNMEAVITLPVGLSFEMNEKGKPKFDYGTRLPQNATISSNVMTDGSMKVVIAGVTDQSFEGNEGTVFSFYVKADENLAQNSEIIISDVLVTDDEANAYVIDEPAKQAVVNAYVAYYEPAMKVVDELKSRFDAAVEKINTEAPTVKDSVLVTDSIAKVGAQVENLRKAVEQAYQDETLAENSETVLAPVANIDQAIEEMVGYALALEQGLVNNEAAYQRLTAEIAAAQTELDAATEKINTECAAVAAQFTETLAGIKAQIDALTADVKAQYEAGKLTAESTVDLTAVKEATTKVVADAAAAQAAYEANEAAYVRLNGEIAAAQTELDAATEKINTECAAVAAQFTETLAGIKAQIDALTADVKAQYEAGKLTAESTVDLTAVKEATTKVVADAAAAQAAYEANEAAYVRLNGEIAAAQTELDAATEKINTECAAVAAQFTETLAGIKAQIDALTADVKAQYEAGKLTAESTVDLTAVKKAVEKVVADAAAAQAVVDANEAAYERLSAEIAAVQTQLDSTKKTIETECAAVAEDYVATLESLQSEIDGAFADLKKQYDAVALNESSKVYLNGIISGINKALKDAQAGQAAVEANQAAYERLTAVIAVVQKQLDDAKNKIETEYADVADQFKETAQTIQIQINTLTADLQNRYEAGKLTAESTVETSLIEGAITKMLADASGNQAAVIANEAAYKRLTAEIATVQTQLDNAKKTIETECADVAANYVAALESLQSDIDGISADVKKQYEAVSLNENSKVYLSAITTGIATALKDAQAAQAAFEADEAAKAANEAAYVRLTAEIAAVEAELDTAKTTIETEYAAVAAQFENTIAGIQSQIKAIADDVKAQYEAVKLTAESTVDLTAVNKAIEQVVADAAAAQEAYEADEAAKAANEAAYVRLTAEIAAVEAELDTAKTTIETEYAAVAAQFENTIAGIQSQIKAIADDVKAQYEAVKLTADSKVDLTEVQKAIAQVVTDAAAAQEAHEADEAAKAANQAAYERLTAEIAAVQTELDNAKKTIETECADVAEDYVATLEKLQSEIDGVSADLKKQYEAVALDENSKVYLTGITSGIAKALKDAQAGQAAVTANETAYERLNAEIAAVQAELDAAIEKINTECPDVADQFTAEMETLQMQIDGVQEDLDAKYEAVSLDENSKVYLSAVTSGIKKMIEDAIAAQDQATGINDVQTGANQVVAIYTVTGAKVEKPVKGSINIFKYADGSIKKIFVK